jgi:hypothetical protein
MPEAEELLVMFLRLRDQCTCDRTPITECPNYQPGDEAPDAFETEDEASPVIYTGGHRR